jgi:hypothetical protein
LKPLTDRDWKAQLDIRPGTAEHAVGELVDSISESLISVMKSLGPSHESFTLLLAHEELQTLALSLGVTYRDRKSFIRKHSGAVDYFDPKAFKDFSSSKAKQNNQTGYKPKQFNTKLPNSFRSFRSQDFSSNQGSSHSRYPFPKFSGGRSSTGGGQGSPSQ